MAAYVTAVNASQSETRIEAGQFVVAMGGIENARFLLLQQQRFGGELQDNPLVGRSFMDHFGFSPGKAVLPDFAKYFRYDSESGPLMPVLACATGGQDESGNNVAIQLQPAGETIIFGPQYLSKLKGKGDSSRGAEFRIQFIVEPTPCDESAVTLDNELDNFGMRRPVLRWAIKDHDFNVVQETIRDFALALGSSGSGRLLQQKYVDPQTTRVLSVGFHHMGTTRMSRSEKGGVTDRDCRLWGTPNLYLAGSSLFPRVGFSNPTFTIVALAARLAAHIEKGEST